MSVDTGHELGIERPYDKLWDLIARICYFKDIESVSRNSYLPQLYY